MSLNEYRHERGPESSLEDITEQVKKQIFSAMPAVIESYDFKTKTVSAQIPLTEYSETDSGETREEPWTKHEDVPVLFPGGGSFTITWPLEPGDPVLLIFCSRDIADWFVTDGKEPVSPDDYATHPEGACFCLPRLYPEKKNGGKATAKDLIISFKDGPEIHVRADGEVWVTGKKIRLGAGDASQALALAAAVDNRVSALAGKINEVIAAALAGGGLVLPPVPPLAPQASVESKKVFTDG